MGQQKRLTTYEQTDSTVHELMHEPWCISIMISMLHCGWCSCASVVLYIWLQGNHGHWESYILVKNTPKHWYIASLRALYAHSKQKTFTGTARAPRASCINLLLLVAKCTVYIQPCVLYHMAYSSTKFSSSLHRGKNTEPNNNEPNFKFSCSSLWPLWRIG